MKTIVWSTPDDAIFDLFIVHDISIDYIISYIKFHVTFLNWYNHFMNISSVIMNTSINSFHGKKMNINMINAASFVRDVIQLKCTLYIVIVWNLEGLFLGDKRTHINTKPVFLWFTISCTLDKYNSHKNLSILELR
jgi:hypothetical protein